MAKPKNHVKQIANIPRSLRLSSPVRNPTRAGGITPRNMASQGGIPKWILRRVDV